MFQLKHFLWPFSIGLVLVGLSARAQLVRTTANVNIRMAPSMKGNIISTLPRGTPVEIVYRERGWTLVRTESGRRAYVNNKYLREVSEGTAGNICADCENTENSDSSNVESVQEVLDLVNPGITGSFSECISTKLVQGAKTVVRNVYGGRTKSKGKCAKGVRLALNQAGLWTGGGIGHAKDMMPGLKRIGFKNIIRGGMTPKSAPNGSILVYGTPSKGTRGCTGLGNAYGHIEIKESNSSFFSDGNPRRNIQEAKGARCRPLIGVMVMTESCPTCTKSLKRSCGA